jgi:Ion channel.
MDDLLILIMTMGMMLYFIKIIWDSRKYLMKYISSVGGKKPTDVKIKPVIWIPFVLFHGIVGLSVGFMVYVNETDGTAIFRIFLSAIVSFVFLMLLYAFYFAFVVIMKEIIYMKDRTINCILIYSILSCIILFFQIYTNDIGYPKGFLWISAVLYLVNILGIGRIIWIIFNKKILVKSIWSLAIINTSFAIIALSNLVYEIQSVYQTPCYSRTIKSWGDALYFVVISFFTVGYGDLYPVLETTKLLSMIIILSGFTFTAVFVSAALSATIEHFADTSRK